MLRTLSLADVDGEGGRAWASGHGLLLRGTSWACRGWCRARRLWAAWCKAGEISPFPPVYHRPTHQRSFSTPMAQASRTFLLTMPRGNGCSCAPPQIAATRVPMPFYSAITELLKVWPLCPFYLSFVCRALAWPVRGLDTGPLSDRRGAEAQAHLVSRPSPPRCLSTEEMPRLARARSWPCSTLNSPLNPKVLRSASN